MFDLRPKEHPQYDWLINVTVETILQSGITPELVSLPAAKCKYPSGRKRGFFCLNLS